MYRYRRQIWLSAALITALAASYPARAESWNITGKLDLTGSFSDNAFLVNDHETADTDVSVTATPGMVIRGEAARVSGNLDAAIDFGHSITTTRGATNAVRLLGNGAIEWVENTAFFNAQISASDQTVRADLPSSSSASGGSTNRTTVYAMNLSQTFRQRISDLANTSLLLRYSPTITESSEVNDSHTLLGKFSLESGRWFRWFRWGVDASRTETKRNSLPSVDQRTLNSRYTVVLARSLSAVGAVGYERIEDSTLSEPPDGLIWNAGLEVKPGRHTFLRSTYGERYGRKSVNFEGRYEYSPRSSIRATYGESIETALASHTNDLQFLEYKLVTIGNTTFLAPVDTRTETFFNFEGAAFGLQNETFYVKRFGTTAQFAGRRSNLVLQGGWESRDTDSEFLAGDENSDRIRISSSLSYTRKITKRTDGTLILSYSKTSFDTAEERVDEQYSTSVAATYLVAKNVKMTGGLGYILRDTNIVGTGYREFSGFIRFSREF